jgi:general stress protein YciG
MAGTVIGGARAAATNKSKYGEDFYQKIGAKGGAKSVTGGFASTVIGADGLTGRERARVVGAKGGTISRRLKKVVENV